MSKKYLLSEEDLQNLIHESIGFFSDKAKAAVQSGKIIMFSDRVRWIQEFLKEALNEIPVDKLLDKRDGETYGYHGSLEPVEDGKYFNEDHTKLIWNWKD